MLLIDDPDNATSMFARDFHGPVSRLDMVNNVISELFLSCVLSLKYSSFSADAVDSADSGQIVIKPRIVPSFLLELDQQMLSRGDPRGANSQRARAFSADHPLLTRLNDLPQSTSSES